MRRATNHQIAYEYQKVRIADPAHLRSLLQLQARHGAAWFSAGHQSLQLSSYVGVIQIPGLTLEILPKADDPGRTADTAIRWRQVLLKMLHYVYELPVAVPSAAHLADAPHVMLDLFIAALVQAADTLLRQGLVKRYRIADGNRSALKGRLLFAEQLKHNLVHDERFFTRAQVYDALHPLNSILRMALGVAANVAHSAALAARARTLLLHWPELPPVPIPITTPTLVRKTERYRSALELALLLLHHHSPDLCSGTTEAVALLFDMNRLFEVYTAKQLRRAATMQSVQVQIQNEQAFWSSVRVRPDVVVRIEERCFVLDTKWKIPKYDRPMSSDLQQLYVYCHLWNAHHGILIYPSINSTQQQQPQAYAASKFVPNISINGHAYFANILSKDGGLNAAFGMQLLQYLLSLR